MKKLLGIVVLGLLWCNVGFAGCIQGFCINGYGTYEWANGSKYVGKWKGGKRHGEGTMAHSDGKIEKGIWENGKLIDEVVVKLIKIPVHVHILEIDEKGFKTKTEPKHVEADFKKANEIWAQANIFWVLKKIDKIPADTTDFKSRIKWMRKNLNYKTIKGKKDGKTAHIFSRSREIFKELMQVEKHQKDGAMDVYYLPYYPAKGVCAVAHLKMNLPVDQNAKPSYVKRQNPRKEFVIMGHSENPKSKGKCRVDRGDILAHEFGHLLYLDHDVKKEFLMFGVPPGAKKDLKNVRGTKIPKYSVKNARANYLKYLSNPENL